MLSSFSAHRVVLTQHEAKDPGDKKPCPCLLVLCGHPSTKWSGCLLWELKVKKTGVPSPLEVYPAAPLAFWAFVWSAQAGVWHGFPPHPPLVFPMRPRSCSRHETCPMYLFPILTSAWELSLQSFGVFVVFLNTRF